MFRRAVSFILMALIMVLFSSPARAQSEADRATVSGLTRDQEAEFLLNA